MALNTISQKIHYGLKYCFPLPRYLSLNPVAIDISPGAIRVMKFKETRLGLIPIIYKEVLFDAQHDLTDDEIEPAEVDSVVAILKKMKNEFKLKHVVTALPEQKTYIYRTNLPRAAMADIASAIRFNLEENVPLDVEDVNFTYHVVKIEENNIDVVVSVFPKSVVKIYTDILKKAGLIPISFQSESSSIASAVIRKGEARPYLLIRMMENQANVSIVENEIVQYTSKIFVGGKQIQDNLESPEAKTLSQELNRILIYWFTNKKDTIQPHKIQDAIIVGKYSLTEGLVDYLEDTLKIDVHLGSVWTNCFSTDDYIPEITQENSLEYSATVGLAIKALKFK